MEQNHCAVSVSVRETFLRFGSFALQPGYELNVFVATPGEIDDYCIVWRQVLRETNGGQNRMRRFEGRNNAFQFCAESKPFESFCIVRLDIFGSSAVVKKRVFRPDCRVIQTG